MSLITTVPPTLPAPEPGWIPSPLYRMTVDEYEAMVESGALKSRNRFHLINGYLVAKMTQNPPHVVADELLRCGARSASSRRPVPRPRGQADPAPAGGTASPSPTVASCGERSAITRAATPGRTTSPWSIEVADPAWPTDRKLAAEVYGPARHPRLLDRQSGPSPGRGLHRPGAARIRVAHGLRGGTVRPGRDRWAGARPDRRRGGLAIAAGRPECKGMIVVRTRDGRETRGSAWRGRRRIRPGRKADRPGRVRRPARRPEGRVPAGRVGTGGIAATDPTGPGPGHEPADPGPDPSRPRGPAPSPSS